MLPAWIASADGWASRCPPCFAAFLHACFLRSACMEDQHVDVNVCYVCMCWMCRILFIVLACASCMYMSCCIFWYVHVALVYTVCVYTVLYVYSMYCMLALLIGLKHVYIACMCCPYVMPVVVCCTYCMHIYTYIYMIYICIMMCLCVVLHGQYVFTVWAVCIICFCCM